VSNDDQRGLQNGESREQSFVGDTRILRPFLIAALVTALVMGLIVVIRLAAPSPAWRLLPVAVFLIALEAVYTSRWLADPQRRQFNRTGYRVAEMTVIAVALRFLTWFLSGGIPGWEVWRSYLLSPLTFFDGVYFGYLLCAFFAWERAVNFSSVLRALSISEAEEIFYTMPYNEQRQRSFDRPIDRERPSLFRGLVTSWLGGGLLLGLSAALSTVDLAVVEMTAGVRNVIRLGLNSSMLLALLVYFILGLWIISQARLEMMRARWLADGVSADETIVNTWRRSSIAVIALIALVAAFLPIGSTFAAAAVLQLIFGVLLAISQFLFLVFTTLLVALISLFGMRSPLEEAEALPETPIATPPPPAAGTPLDETAALFAGGLLSRLWPSSPSTSFCAIVALPCVTSRWSSFCAGCVSGCGNYDLAPPYKPVTYNARCGGASMPSCPRPAAPAHPGASCASTRSHLASRFATFIFLLSAARRTKDCRVIRARRPANTPATCRPNGPRQAKKSKR